MPNPSIVISPQAGTFSILSYLPDQTPVGVADCHDYIVTAIAACPTQGELVFPDGTYTTSAITIADMKGVTIRGGGNNTILRAKDTDQTHIIKTAQSGSGGVVGMKLSNLCLDGAGKALTCLDLQYKTSGCIFDRVKCLNVKAASGIFVKMGVAGDDSHNQVDFNQFSDCSFYQETGTYAHAKAGVKILGGNPIGNKFDNCIFHGCEYDVWSVDSTQNSTVSLTDCDFDTHKDANSAIIMVEQSAGGASYLRATVRGGYCETVANLVKDTGIDADVAIPITICDLEVPGSFGDPVVVGAWTCRKPLILRNVGLGGNFALNAGGTSVVSTIDVRFSGEYDFAGANTGVVVEH